MDRLSTTTGINKKIIVHCLLFTITAALSTMTLHAQNYQALNGSSYAGSLGVHNNPAAIVGTPYKWDLTLLGTQLKASTNIVTIYNYSLLSNPQKSEYQLNAGDFKRYGKIAFNLNLLNTRIALDRKQAIAFGANVKSYTNVKSSSYNFIDTMSTSGDFFKINHANSDLFATVRSSSWIELYGSYARTLLDNGTRRLNGGITLKLNKGLSGATVDLKNTSFSSVGPDRYTINSILLRYAYSANYDKLDNHNSNASKFNDFLRFTSGGLSFDAGVEYLVKEQTVPVFNEDDDYYDYTWKFGAAILDAGFTGYMTGKQSRILNNLAAGVTNVSLDNKFDSTVTSFQAFTDSLSTLAASFEFPSADFNIINPMRLVLNADRHIRDHFFINAELTINVASVLKKYMSITDMNMLTLTPRWETRRWGAYLPVQFTTTNKFWIGGAFKAGPLLIGVHNWANIFSKAKIQQGGGYIALVIRAGQAAAKKYDKRLDCPSF